MAIPDYQSIMLPLLKLTNDGKEHSIHDIVDTLAHEFKLTNDERKELLPSGQQEIFFNRVGWARTYLKKAGLLEAIRRGFFKVSKRGVKLLEKKPVKIDNKLLSQFEEFKKFKTRKKKIKVVGEIYIDKLKQTPEEAFESAYENLKGELSIEMLNQLKNCPPSLFEKIVVEVLVKMGYGGSLKDAGKAVGRSGDEGIDGIIKEDKLGLDIIYIQAKRWENTVGRPEIQKFAGALQGQRARKGIFITTSNFSKDAEEYATSIDSKIILIDGDTLTEYMIDLNVGVTTTSTYQLKKVDLDYFIKD